MNRNVRRWLAVAGSLRPLEKRELVIALLEDLDRPDSDRRSGRTRSYSLTEVLGKKKSPNV